jgi:hypothetical protein
VTKKALGLTLIVGALTVAQLTFAAPAGAANPKFDACLKEAQSKGLYIPAGANSQAKSADARANRGLASQRQAFMKECMARR